MAKIPDFLQTAQHFLYFFFVFLYGYEQSFMAECIFFNIIYHLQQDKAHHASTNTVISFLTLISLLHLEICKKGETKHNLFTVTH